MAVQYEVPVSSIVAVKANKYFVYTTRMFCVLLSFIPLHHRIPHRRLNSRSRAVPGDADAGRVRANRWPSGRCRRMLYPEAAALGPPRPGSPASLLAGVGVRSDGSDQIRKDISSLEQLPVLLCVRFHETRQQDPGFEHQVGIAQFTSFVLLCNSA